jgi:L-aspartate oxidase
MHLPRRYLVPFNPRRTAHYFTDVLILGAGIAGLRAAIEIPPPLDVLVISKGKLQQSSSNWAQGGIAGVLDPEDRFENHIEDTLGAGAGLCDPAVVQAVIREAPAHLNELVSWGTRFDLEEGRLALTLEGGHSHRRIVHAFGDATGQEVMRAVAAKALASANLSLWEDAVTLDLLTDEGACVGAAVHRATWGLALVWARQVILATGGAGQLYRETTNPAVATGDGMAAAYRAGAALRDMEFMQFHPTVLYVAGSARHLISEAVRGEGAYLRDKNGHRFMPEADPRAELAPRDIVARAISRQMDATKHANVYLDLSHLDADMVRKRFPGIDRVCRGFDLDIAKDWIPVRPGAHYMIGGVTVDLRGRTTVPGLWAAGEVTSSGLHGANRLASNSLLEGLAYGKWCGHGAAAACGGGATNLAARPLDARGRSERGALDAIDLRNSLQSVLGRKAGIVRDRAGLTEALEDIEFWCRYVLAQAFPSAEGWELQNLLTVARLLVWGALQREESRGTHYRSDFPERRDDVWRRHVDAPMAQVAPLHKLDA